MKKTTILAQQHYNNFVQRMKDFPVNIDLLCRFRSSAEQKKTIEKLKKGQVDIIIGTHRLLSKDVVYKDLGLLIIDEELSVYVKSFKELFLYCLEECLISQKRVQKYKQFLNPPNISKKKLSF